MERHIGKVDFRRDPNVGLFGIATDEYTIVGEGLNKNEYHVVESFLKTKLVRATVAETELVGIFAAGNSNGLVLPKIRERDEVAALKKLGINVLVLKTKETALGNLILVNDRGCVIAKELAGEKRKLIDALGVDVEVATIAGLDIVGSSAIVTNRGLLAHRNCSEEEMKRLEEILHVPGDIGTVAFGSPFVGAGILANSFGFVTSSATTGPELQRIDESLGFV